MDIKLVLLVGFVISLVLSLIVNPLFIVVSLGIIILLSYIKQDMSRLKENYTNYNFTLEKPEAGPVLTSCGARNASTGAYTPWCNDYEQLQSNETFFSKNQFLAGPGAHPRTRVAPLIVPPAVDSFWKKNEFTKYPRMMNRPSQQDLYLSGYMSCIPTNPVKECYGEERRDDPSEYKQFNGGELAHMYAEETAKQYISRKNMREIALGNVGNENVNNAFVENVQEGAYKDPFRAPCQLPNTNINFSNPDMKNPCTWNCAQPLQNNTIPAQYNKYKPISKITSCVQGSCGMPSENEKVVENFEYPITESMSTRMNGPYNQTGRVAEPPQYPYYDTYVRETRDVGDDFVNKECAYNPAAINNSLPVNKCTGEAQQQPGYTNYNKNEGTQIIQPGLYYRSEVLDPINSNIGISFTQQFQPQTAKMENNGDVIYTDHDATQFAGVNIIDNSPTGEELHNIYDPRLTGYGPNDRMYIDKMTGQPRFFYDDIDAVKKPSYIVRSNVDHLGAFDQTGAMKHGELNFDYRGIANTQFAESTLDMRTDIATRLAQMNYTRTAQRRDMPLSNTGRMRGR